MLSYQSLGLNFPALAEYNFGHDFYNQNMIHLTKSDWKKHFKQEFSHSYIPTGAQMALGTGGT